MGSWHLRVPLPSCGSSISPQQELALHQIGATAQNLQHGGFVHSSFYNGGHLTSPIPNGSRLISLCGAPQQVLAFQQTAPVAPQYLFNTVVTRHSGMWPHKYAEVVLQPCVKNCLGCGSSFADKYRNSPYNLVVNHVDRRITGKNDYTGQSLYGRSFSTHITTS